MIELSCFSRAVSAISGMHQPKRGDEVIAASGDESQLGLWREAICAQGKPVSNFTATFTAGVDTDCIGMPLPCR